MLESLSIENFILIDKLECGFKEGLSVITGETGAGKSIIIDAILFASGAKFNKSVIKADSKEAIVTLKLRKTRAITDLFKEYLSDAEYIALKRVQGKSSKSFFINDRLIDPEEFGSLTSKLIIYQGQHSHNYLISPGRHLEVLDSFAGVLEPLRELEFLYGDIKSCKSNLAKLSAQEKTLANEKEYLAHAIAELQAAGIKIGEEIELTNSRIELQSAFKQKQTIHQVYEMVMSLDLGSKLGRLERLTSKLEVKSAQILSDLLQQIGGSCESLESEVGKLYAFTEVDDTSLEEIEQRLFYIRTLAKKYNTNSDGLPDLLIEYKEKYEDLLKQFHSQQETRGLLKQLEDRYLDLANSIFQRREKAARKLESIVLEILKSLNMEKTRFKVDLTSLPEGKVNSIGIENARFLASINPGTPLMPIDKIASGGELSRFMLAVRVALLEYDFRPILIFDEIDTGISGSIADLIGENLKKLTKKVQVIAITHQPQVSAKADHHILVTKYFTSNSTNIRAQVLNKTQRVSEIARMISGAKVSEASLEAAKSLIDS